MGPWGFVFLAYGIVGSSLGLYLALLKRRLKRAEEELARRQRGSKQSAHDSKA